MKTVKTKEPKTSAHVHRFHEVEVLRFTVFPLSKDWRPITAWVCDCGETGYPIP